MAHKIILLFSGGLDSMAAAEILQRQKAELTGLALASYFFDTYQAKISAQKIGLKLIERNIAAKHLELVRKPRYGYGKGMNPCLDCHALMLKEAWRLKDDLGFDILATGDVLGQRPFSQKKPSFQIIDKLSGLEGKVLRPLSAKLLPETEFEKKGLINRELLEGIQGRSRKKQIEILKKIGINDYPSSAGGCCLTEKGFSLKLEKLLNQSKVLKPSDFKLIKIGRHFWFKGSHIILGRDERENALIQKNVCRGDLFIEPKNFKGPVALIRGENSELNQKKVESLIRTFSKKAPLECEYNYFNE
jgi:tRNA U34 2-thiouridine synthase MnmA/TrmU